MIAVTEANTYKRRYFCKSLFYVFFDKRKEKNYLYEQKNVVNLSF